MTKFGTHVRIDLGMVPTYKKIDPQPQGGAELEFEGVKKSKVREMS